MTGMEIRIVIHSLDPPTGVLRPESPGPDGSPVEIPFIGWLGLLTALSEILRSVDPESTGRT